MANNLNFQFYNPKVRLERLDMLTSSEDYLYVTISFLPSTGNLKIWNCLRDNVCFSLFYVLLSKV